VEIRIKLRAKQLIDPIKDKIGLSTFRCWFISKAIIKVFDLMSHELSPGMQKFVIMGNSHFENGIGNAVSINVLAKFMWVHNATQFANSCPALI
jgi:hypothetical protein